jgi:ribonuclease HI
MWLSVVPYESRGSFFGGDLESWINYNLSSDIDRINGIRWEDFWATACHCLWSWRNKEQHVDDFSRPVHAVVHILQRCRNYYNACVENKSLNTIQMGVRWIVWKAPEEGWVKLNTDGASKGKGLLGCGGIIRDHQGNWCGGFAKFVGTGSALIAELWGVLEGLKLAGRKGYRKVEVNIDSISVVKMIMHGGTSSALGFSLVKSIRRLLDDRWDVKILHSYREANKCADALASMGCILDCNIVFFETCPSSIRNLFSADVMGFSTPRLIAL